jgi:hypothetical protein
MLRWWSLALVSTLLMTGRAHAWTDAHVREVEVEIALADEGRAQVTMLLSVEVGGGWLERLDLPGLDEELDAGAPPTAWLELPDGTQQPAGVRIKHGELSLRFEKAVAPRRGQHRLGVRYQTLLLGRASEALGDGMVRLRHALPGWEAGLVRGEVRWRLPAGARAVDDPSIAQQVQQASGLIRFARVHVPRTTPWVVAVDVPEQALGVAGLARTERSARASGGRPLATGAWLAAALLAFGWLSRATTRLAARRDGLEARPLGRAPVRRAARVVCFAVGAVAWPLSLAGAVLLWVLGELTFVDRCELPGQAPGLGRFVPITSRDLARATRRRWLGRLGIAPVSDLSTLLGGLGAAAAALSLLTLPGALDLASDPWGLGAACALVPLCSSLRVARPRSVAEQVALLAKSAGTLVTVGSALRLVWYVADGVAREPRLRILPFARYPGLLRVELAVDTRRFAAPLVLLVVVEADAPADRWLAAEPLAAGRELSAGGRRALYLVPVRDDLTEVIEALFARLAQHSQERWQADAAQAA